MMEKKCSKCKEIKSVKKFSKDKYSQSGYTSQCLDCRNANNKTDEHRETQRGYSAKYRQTEKGKEAIRLNKIFYRSTDHGREVEKRYEQSDKNRKRRGEYNKSEAGKKSVRRYRRSDKGKETIVRYNQTAKGKEFLRRKSLIRRTNITQAGGSYTSAEWYKLCEFYGFRCLKCNKQFPLEKLEVDHVKPVSKGGSSAIWNLQPLCGKCNRKKHNKEIDYRQTVPDWISRDVPVWQQDRLF